MAGPRRAREVKRPLGCHERALGLLAIRPRSRRELESRLLRAGFEESEVREELVRLEAVGLVDDERFASELAEHQLVNRQAGRRAVTNALLAKGVDRLTIERTLEGSGGDDEGRAFALARARAQRLAGLPREKAYARLTGLLVRRGHAPELARRAARAALEVPEAEE